MSNNDNLTKKILVLTENFPPISGGSGRWFWELYSRLPREQVLIVANDIEGGSEFDETHDLNIIRIPLHSSEWGLKSIKGLRFYWRCIKQIRKIIKQHNITEIHCGRVIHEGVTAWLLKLLTGIPYLCFIHGEDVETAASSREQYLLVKQAVKNSNMIICNSQNSANLVVDLGYSASNKLHVLNPGVNAKQFIPFTEDKDFKESMGWSGRKVIITVGRLQERKGQDMMVRAMKKIKSIFPESLYVVIGDGDCKGILEQLVASEGLSKHIAFHSNLTDEEMIQCYQQCDLFILPNRTVGSDIEGFGMVLVEAQSCGKPVIAGDSGGTRETMLVGETGFIIDCTQEKVISETIIELLKQPERLAEMGSKGRLHVEKTLDWEAHAQRASKLFKL